jgi:undecaprenyl-diphosphatase
MYDYSLFQRYYTELIDFILALPLWVDLLFLGVVVIVFYLLMIMMLPTLRKVWIPLIPSLWGSLKEAFGKNDDFISLKKEYPRTFSFIHSRLDTSYFFGLPLTLFVLLFLYIAALFGGIVEDFVTNDSIVELDHLVAAWSSTIRTDFFNDFFWVMTRLGSIEIIALFVAFFTLFLCFGGRRYYIAGLYLSIFGSEVLTIAGKYAFARERPLDALYQETLFSFPSGHATIAVAFFGFVLYTFFQETPNFRSKLNLFFIALVIVFLIGFSRIYLGVHYISDVLAGYLVGAMWMVIGMAVSEYQRSRALVKKLDIKESHYLAFAVGIVAFVCYILYLYWHPFT